MIGGLAHEYKNGWSCNDEDCKVEGAAGTLRHHCVHHGTDFCEAHW